MGKPEDLEPGPGNGKQGGAEDFDDMLDELGGLGKYQKRLLYLLLGPLFLIMPFPLLHQVLVLHAPKHECIPLDDFGAPRWTAEEMNMTKTAWQEIFLPTEMAPDYSGMAPSSCNYYNISEENVQVILEGTGDLAQIQADSGLASCSQWTYDDSEFKDTLVTENDWVCGVGHYVSDLYTLGVVGLILGTFVFSAIADFFGRKTSFYIGIVTVMLFTFLQIPVSYSYDLFALFKVLATFGMLPLFQSPLNILCEICDVKNRGYVICFACLTWSLGQIAFPLVGWLIASWRLIKIVSVAPLVFLLFSWKMLPESPRWLISKSRTKEASKILTKIAETNGVRPPADLTPRLQKIAEANKETSLGYLSLFGTPILCARTVMITIGFTASAFVYYQMVINVSNMVGNTFLNLFLLGLVEGPGNVLGTVLANKVGRRWTHSTLLGINALLFAAVMVMVPYQYTDAGISIVIQVLCMILKMNISATFVVAYIQAMEVFPTSVRQSGIGFCSFISQMISIGGPYAMAAGAVNVMIPYMIMMLICLAGSIATSFLPETLGAKLPETLEDANQFGRTDKYFSLKPNRGYTAPTEQNIIKK